MIEDEMRITELDLLQLTQTVRRVAILRAAIKLRVFDSMAAGPATAADIAAGHDLDARGTRILLDSLVAIGMLHTADSRYRLAAGATELLVSTSAGYFGAAIELTASDYEWEALGRLADSVRQGGTVLDQHAELPDYPFWTDLARNPTAHTAFVAGLLADTVAPRVSAAGWFDVLDVACGHGLYGFGVAQRFPTARIRSVDWQDVLGVAAAHARELGVAERVEFTPGDMFTVDLAGPYDLTLITNVLHHFSAERATVMLRRLASVTKPGGLIGIVAITADREAPRADPVPHLFSALMLAWTHGGESHSLDDYCAMLTASGFTAPTVHTLPAIPLRLLLAEREQDSRRKDLP
ncbi:class I SAM-dependent methyltransferase [Nocardia sp. NPDC020380]|uniref:class I SAM-dependent methyltransferase n=1 Tax=Nocardia sp. NPDC020380 TaxID=3364309 RepID=UPI003796BDEE